MSAQHRVDVERLLAMQAAIDELVTLDSDNPWVSMCPTATIEEQERRMRAWIAIRELATGAKA